MNKIQNMIFARQKTPLLQPQAVVFITGCSSGIGNMLAQLLLEKGYKVVFTARKPAQIAQHLQDKYPQTSLCLHCDVTNQDTIKAAVQETVLKFGGIDVLINNAGVGYYGILESADISTIRNLFLNS